MKPRRKPLVLIIRDGWGHNPYLDQDFCNAVVLARTPVDERLRAEYPWTQIHTSGEDVGLPAGVMGNSEVGHQNIGAGRIVDQEVMRITRRIRDGSFFENSALCGAIEFAARHDGRLHIMGLCSDAGVHSVLEHLYALLELCKRRGFPGERVFVHFFGDGRDTPPNSGVSFAEQIEAKMREVGVGRIASVVGRYWAMDRDNRWDRVERAYSLLTRGEGLRARSAGEALRRYYENPTQASMSGDEFVEPTAIVDERGEPLATIGDGDGVIFFNFRGDRPRELTRAFVAEPFPYVAADKDGTQREMGFSRERKLDLYFATMTAYKHGLPVHVAFDKPPRMHQILGEYISGLGLRQLRTAETEKFPHVTFFFNDYRDEPFHGEERRLIASPRDVKTYDEKPEMSALQVTDGAVEAIASGGFDVVVINFANGDMVGHTGNLQAAIRAVETVDACVGRVVEATQRAGGCLIVTADHGNCEQMIDRETGAPHTAHTTYDVDLIVVDEERRGARLREGGRLADIAPTALEMIGLPQPPKMTGRSLLQL